MPWHMTPDIWWNMKLKLHMKIDSEIDLRKVIVFADSTTMVISSPILHHHTISCSFFFAWNFFQPHPASIRRRRRRWSVRWRKNNPQGLSLTFRYGVSSWNSLPKLQGEELRLSGDRGGPALWGS